MGAGTAWMFPNPGSHLPGVLKPLLDGAPSARTTLETVDGISQEYGWGAVSGLLLGTAPHREGPEHTWLGFYATSLVIAEIFTHDGRRPDVVLGHSSGEVTALVYAGCMSVADGTRVLCERIKAVNSTGYAGAMTAAAASERRVARLCRLVDEWSLVVAVDNGPRQVVVSGPHRELAAFEDAAKALDIKTNRLSVPGAFHHPRFEGAAQNFTNAIADIEMRPPDTRVYSPQLGRYVAGVRDVREILAGILIEPVRFRLALTTLYDDGVDEFVECGARQVLSGIATGCLPSAARIVPTLTSRTDIASLLGKVTSDASASTPVVPKPAAPSISTPKPAPEPSPSTEPPPIPAPAPAPAPASATETADGMLSEVQRIYADAVQYPVEVFEGNDELEADLGISSLRQTQVFTQLLDHFELPTPPPDVRITSYRTIPQVVELLQQLAADR